jgi:hypothetical protein
MRAILFALTAAFLAGCGKDDSSGSSGNSTPGWTSISGGKEVRFAGVIAEIPGSWNEARQGNATLILPPGSNQGVVEELYALLGEPTLKTLDVPGLESYLDNALMQMLQVPVRREGSAASARIGALEGRAWKWSATLMDGRAADIRCWAFVGSYVGSLVAVATPEALQRRMPEIEQILGSIRRPPAAAVTAAALCNTWVRAYGSRTALTGNSNEQRISFTADGRFHYHSEGTSHGLFHSGSSQTDVYGSWKLSGDQLTGTTDGGESKTFTVEARTEAGTGAAVLAIDGTEFRQADGRPW